MNSILHIREFTDYLGESVPDIICYQANNVLVELIELGSDTSKRYQVREYLEFFIQNQNILANSRLI